jgi:hypothetical protein
LLLAYELRTALEPAKIRALSLTHPRGGGTWPSGQRSALACRRFGRFKRQLWQSDSTFRSDLLLTARGSSM